jgi:hypothetical protein
MTRAYHSPSSTSLVDACEYAAALRYVAGWREPEVTWAEIEAGAPHEPRQRSTALGKAMHEMAEAWLRGEEPLFPSESLPGQIFRSGYHLLPDPRSCLSIRVEAELGDRELDDPGDDGPQRYRLIAGVRWAGFVDYQCIPISEEITRLELPITLGEVVTIDHKSTSNIRLYAKTAGELLNDLQAAVYAVAHCETYHVDSAPMRWVYYQTKGATASRAIDFRFTYHDALAVVARHAPLAMRLDSFESLEDAVQNPLACNDYGGRPCHHSRGGPCHPQTISPGKRLVQLRAKREKEQKKMGETASFAKFRKPKQEAAEGEVDVTESAVEVPGDAPAKPAERVRKPRPATKAKADAPAAPALPADSMAAKVAALSAELTAAEIQLASATEELDTAKAAVESAGAAFDSADQEHDRIRAALREALA